MSSNLKLFTININLEKMLSNLLIISTLVSFKYFAIHASTSATESIGIEMKRSPESTVAPLGDEVLFECELNLAPERLEWRFQPLNGHNDRTSIININDKTPNYNITTKNKISKLKIFVSKSSVGEYQCVVWFGASAVASVPAKLILADISLDKKFGLTPQDGNSIVNNRQPTQQFQKWDVPIGNNILIKCNEVYSNPDPLWIFYKDDRTVSPSQQLPIGALVLQSVSKTDSGTYWCAAFNTITGNDVKLPQRINLNVREALNSPPKFLFEPPSLISVRPGSKVLLECPGIGNPVPKSTWSRPDKSISNRSKIFGSHDPNRHEGVGLLITNVTKDDGGLYFCRLDNGEAPPLIHKIELQILEIPKILHGPKTTLTNESDSLELECLTDGTPTPEIYWMINGQNCKWDSQITVNNSKIIIKSVEKRHAGIVQCFARNDVGESTAWNLLQVIPKQISGEVGSSPLGTVPHSTKSNFDHTGKPPKKKHRKLMVPPSRPVVTRLSDESVMVRWSVPSNDGLPIQFFKVQYRILSDVNKTVQRSQWMTTNEDIPPHVRSYEVDNLKPDYFYRFRIAAVYSNNDNLPGNVSTKFLLQRGSELGPARSHLVAPTLQTIEPVSETVIVLHWDFPANPPNPVDGFYAYYRPASTAGEYSKATVDGMLERKFRIDHLEPGTAYEFKLQSFTSSAASDFSAILTGKTLKPPTPPPSITPSVISNSESSQKNSSLMTYGLPGAIIVICLIVFICLCVCIKRCKNSSRDDDDITENKSHHPDHIQADGNGFSTVGNVSAVGNPGSRGVLGSPIHKRNGIAPRMNITPNPLAQDTGDKNRNVMELRFLPTGGGGQQPINLGGSDGRGGGISGGPNHHHAQQHHQHHPHHHHHQSHSPSPGGGSIIIQPNNNCPTPDPHRRTLERSLRNIQQHHHNNEHNKMLDGDLGICRNPPPPGSRRTRRSSGSGPGNSPRIMRGVSSEYLQHNRSPMPVRAATAAAAAASSSSSKRGNRLGNRTENMSSGSLNSIEV